MNLSLLYKNNQTLLLFITLVGVLLFSIISANYILSAVLFVILLISIFVPSGSSNTTSNIQAQMIKVVKNAADGKLEGRVTHIPDNNSLESDFAWAINDLLDQLEAFMRDTSTTINNASVGKTYRRTYSSGLHGLFQIAARNLNQAIASIASGYETKIRGELSESLGELGGGVGEGLGVIQQDLSASSDDSLKIVEVSQKTADESSKSLESVVDIGGRLNTLVELISTSHEGIINLRVERVKFQML